MATKAQAKAAIDNAVTQIKADIDKLPAGVNITDGNISFGPIKWVLLLNAGGLLVTATTLRDSILAFLTTDGRTYKVKNAVGRRFDDVERVIEIETDLCIYYIRNF